MSNFVEYFPSKYGLWRITATDKGVSGVKLVSEDHHQSDQIPSKITSQAATELERYFKKVLRIFNVPIDIKEGTEFQQQIWKELSFIEYGKTVSYQKIANEIGNPNSVRAVGAANGANPVAIILPCHRVIGSDGSLTGYAYGIDLKRNLLLHEEAISKSLFD